jgi:dihydroflavonol-4-reductase
MSTNPLVLVTGVSGFIGSWVAYAALKAGYRVRGTVRSLKNEAKVHHLRDLCPGSKHSIELVEADLTSDSGWDEAVAGCHYILHVASPFVISEPKDPNDVIVPAVQGTLRVLQAAARQSSSPRRVVITSSVYSVCCGHSKDNFTDDDWTILENSLVPVNSYAKSKTLAEKAAWEFVKNLPPHQQFELATINPSGVLGPMLSTTTCPSGEIMEKILLAKYPGLPDMRFGIVSIFDVVRAHLLAMIHPQAAGKRFIVNQRASGLREYSSVLVREFQKYGYKPLTMTVPNWMMHFLAFFGDAEAKGGLGALSKTFNIESNNARTILGLDFRHEFDMIKEMTLAMIVAGIIPDKSEGQILTKNYQRPVFDTSMIPPAEEILL